jgi:hypothetical protein
MSILKPRIFFREGCHVLVHTVAARSSFIHSFIHSNNMSSPSSSSSSSSALSQSTETTYSLALTFQVFKHGDEHQLLAFDVIKTVVLAGRPHDRIAKGLAMVNNIPEALPQYFFCGGDTAWISVDETMTHALSPDTSGAAGECAIYANGWLRSPDMVELQVSEVRTAESYSLEFIKQKFLLLIKKHLGIQQDAPVGDLSAREQDLVGREQDLVGREQDLAGREQAFAGREQDLADREQVFEENGTEVKRLQAENNAKNVEQVQKISELANKHKDITAVLIKREEAVAVREVKVAAGEKAIESVKTQLMDRAKVISTNRKELENDVTTLALNRARLNEEAASFKIAQNKLQEQMKAAAKSQKSNSSSESSDSDDDGEDGEDDEDDDESSEDDDDEVDQTGKRKRETNNASVKPLSKKAIKSWDNQRLQPLRVEYERICGREPGNRIRNNSTYMQKGIALAKAKAKR